MNPAITLPTNTTSNFTSTISMPNSANHVDAELARISAELKGAIEKLAEMAGRLEAAQARTDRQVEELKRDVLHYKGVIGGAMFVFSGMWAALIAFKSWIFKESGD